MRGSVLAVGAAGLTAAVAVGVLLATRSRARRIRTFPDPVPLDDLLREPTGDDVIVERPDGTRLRVRIAGTGPPVVLAHGIALTLGEWNLVADLLLADGYRVVAFDARGHGQSTIGTQGVSAPVMAADLAAVLEATGTTDAILVGHSMGGFLALEAVLEVPEVPVRLAGLVRAATFAGDILDGHRRTGSRPPSCAATCYPGSGPTPPSGPCSPRRSSAPTPPPRC